MTDSAFAISGVDNLIAASGPDFVVDILDDAIDSIRKQRALMAETMATLVDGLPEWRAHIAFMDAHIRDLEFARAAARLRS